MEQIHVKDCQPIDPSSSLAVNTFGSLCLGVFVIRKVGDIWWIRISRNVLFDYSKWGTNGRVQLTANDAKMVLHAKFKPHNHVDHLLCVKWHDATARPHVYFKDDAGTADADECEAISADHRGAIH